MDVLDDYAITDPHHHLWLAKDRMRPNMLPVMQEGQLPSFGTMKYNNADYTYQDYLRDFEEAGVKLECSVYLECGWLERGPIQQSNESRWVHSNSVVPSNGVVARGIVGHVNLMRPLAEVEACIAEHFTVPEFRGLRYSVTNDPSGKFHGSHRDANAYENERMLRAMPLFERYDMSLELWCYSHQIVGAAALAAKFPKVRMVLDHFGGPLEIGTDPDGTKFKTWAASMEVLAKQPNVQCKLSGLMAHLGLGYHLKPNGATRWEIADGVFGKMIEHTVRVFGVDRCFFASNFPVDKANAPLGELIRANMIVYKRMGLGYEDRRKLFRTNALKFYRLTPPSGKL